ncbi:hypothetical protein ADL26_16295 [Thermoactinomyces vulgaris]|nr:hypothetical protein ADL26_16295 [Thermoactinomyces vulgaris]
MTSLLWQDVSCLVFKWLIFHRPFSLIVLALIGCGKEICIRWHGVPHQMFQKQMVLCLSKELF